MRRSPPEAMMMRKLRPKLAVALGSTLALISSAGAFAASPVAQGSAGSARMHVIRFDAAVAAAHGFAIVTGDDSRQRSIPVTDEAIQLMAQASARAEHDDVVATGNGEDLGEGITVGGDCGTSYLDLDYDGRNLHISTGYNVYLPSLFHTWLVQYNGGGRYGFHTYPFDGGPSGPSWSSGRVENAPGSSAGRYGNVASSSFVLLVNGAYCQTGSPYDYS